MAFGWLCHLMVSSLAELPNANLLRLLLPLTFHSFHCSDEKATGFTMEVGFHEEPHFAIMTELSRLSHHGDSEGRLVIKNGYQATADISPLKK